MKAIKASEFKAKCLRLMDEVAESGIPLVITKNGKPVAQLGPVIVRPSIRSTHSESVAILTSFTRSSALTAKMPIPCLQKGTLMFGHYALQSPKLPRTDTRIQES